MIMFLFMLAVGATAGHPTGYSADSDENEVYTYNFPYFTRSQWNARCSKQVQPLHTPVPYVVIHHSYTPAACYSGEECAKAMRSMQDFHMDGHGWWDIGYSFAVGSDGAAYEGRGWKILGAHAKYFNTVSIGICVIGDWTSKLPPAEQLKTTKALIAAGVKLGFIDPDYKLVGHRQVRATDCPGDKLFEHIKSWDNFSSFPASHKDLLTVKEIPDIVKDELRNITMTS